MLIEKAIGIAGMLLELSGKTKDGAEHANRILTSGKALEKFREIIEAQGGDPNIKSDEILIGDLKYDVKALDDGAVAKVDNNKIVKVARASGAPKDKGAGILLHEKKGHYVKAGDTLFTIYAEKDWKLEEAIEVATREPPMTVSGMIMERHSPYRTL